MAYGESWLYRLLDKLIGEQVDRLGQRFSPDFLFVRRLERTADNPTKFAKALERLSAVPLRRWSRASERALMQLENRLATSPSREHALNRAMIHDMFSANECWSISNIDTACEHWEDNISAHLFSGYQQLIKYGETAALQKRFDHDSRFFLSLRYQALATSYAKARRSLSNAAQSSTDLFKDWNDETILSLETNALNPAHQTRNGHVDARYIHSSVIQRYVRLSAQQTGTIAQAIKLLEGMPSTYEYKRATMAVFSGMVEAVKAGAEITFSQRHSKLGNAVASILKSNDPWLLLGKTVIDRTETPIMGDPLHTILTPDVMGKRANDLDDNSRQRLFDGIQIALGERLKDTTETQEHVSGLLSQVNDYVVFRKPNGRQIAPIRTDKEKSERPTTAAALDEIKALSKIIRQRSPLRAAILDEFNTLARAKTTNEYDSVLRTHNQKTTKILLEQALADNSLDVIFERITQDKPLGTRSRLAALGAMIEAVGMGVAPVINTHTPEERAQAVQLETLLRAKNPWHALGRVMVLTTGPSQSAHPLGDLVNVFTAKYAASILDVSAHDAMLDGIMDGMRSTLKAKKRGATAKVEKCLRALDQTAVMKTHSGKVVHAELVGLCKENEQYHARREAAGKRIEALVTNDPVLLLRRTLKPGSKTTFTYQRPDVVSLDERRTRELESALAAALDIAINPDERIVIPFKKPESPRRPLISRIAASF